MVKIKWKVHECRVTKGPFRQVETLNWIYFFGFCTSCGEELNYFVTSKKALPKLLEYGKQVLENQGQKV